MYRKCPCILSIIIVQCFKFRIKLLCIKRLWFCQIIPKIIPHLLDYIHSQYSLTCCSCILFGIPSALTLTRLQSPRVKPADRVGVDVGIPVAPVLYGVNRSEASEHGGIIAEAVIVQDCPRIEFFSREAMSEPLRPVLKGLAEHVIVKHIERASPLIGDSADAAQIVFAEVVPLRVRVARADEGEEQKLAELELDNFLPQKISPQHLFPHLRSFICLLRYQMVYITINSCSLINNIQFIKCTRNVIYFIGY